MKLAFVGLLIVVERSQMKSDAPFLGNALGNTLSSFASNPSQVRL